MAPIQFALKPLKKRRRRQDENKEKEKRLCNAFDSIKAIEEELKNKVKQVNHRVELLEDVQVKVKRLKDEGNILAEAGRFQAAMNRWKEALGLDPNNAVLYELLAQASMAVYEDFQAVQFARTATELAPLWSDGYLTLARSHLNFGELTLALRAVDKAVELNRGVETEEIASDRKDIEKLLIKQKQVLNKHDEEAAHLVEADKLQVILCFKHLTLRAKIIGDK
ncbi:unnamed protein product [Peronospora belbahrii]|uniref:Tetratricopeptide repeat protein n=1 Tax=Peronospora belbahrii TaxID=622444 RepID=A0AAU9L7T2_9STRA|nr:unnamed protein product [Peronospora belbahrii]CAH0517872.1 unnamed protein product [Peronospora belbahrii]